MAEPKVISDAETSEIPDELLFDEGGPAKLSDQILDAYEDDEISLTVSRKAKNGRKIVFLFEVDEYDSLPALQTKLRDEYGGGEFVIQGRRGNGTFALSQALNIEEPKKDKDDNSQNQSNDFQSILLAMQESNARMAQETRDLMVTMNNSTAQAQIDAQKMQMDTLFKMMELNKPVPQESTSLADMLALMVQMRALQPEPVDPTKILLQGMELAKEMSGGGNSDDSLLQTAIKEFGKPLVSMATHAQAELEKANAATLAAPVVSPALPPALSPPQTNENPEMLKLLKFKSYLERLIMAAKDNMPFVEVAPAVLKDVDPELIRDYIINEENYLKLYTYVPDAVPVKVWLDNLRQEVLRLIVESQNNDNKLEDDGLTNDDDDSEVHIPDIPKRTVTGVHGQQGESETAAISDQARDGTIEE